MAKTSREAIKTLTIIKDRDIVVDRLIRQCKEGDHPKCTGWAVLKKELSPIDANYFLRCTCACHKKKMKNIASKVKKGKKKRPIRMVKRKNRRKSKESIKFRRKNKYKQTKR